jgi:hypothetical protein
MKVFFLSVLGSRSSHISTLKCINNATPKRWLLSHWGGVRFEFWPEHRQSFLSLMEYSYSSRQILVQGHYFKLGHDRFLPHPFFTDHHFICLITYKQLQQVLWESQIVTLTKVVPRLHSYFKFHASKYLLYRFLSETPSIHVLTLDRATVEPVSSRISQRRLGFAPKDYVWVLWSTNLCWVRLSWEDYGFCQPLKWIIIIIIIIIVIISWYNRHICGFIIKELIITQPLNLTVLFPSTWEAKVRHIYTFVHCNLRCVILKAL